MATETDESRTETAEQEEEGGPIKTFLEHLEDLRWVLIKSLSTLGIAVVVCLLAGNVVVSILMRPLGWAKVSYRKEAQVVSLQFGTNRVGVFQLTPDQRERYSFGTNRFVGLQIEPITIGTNQVLGLRLDPEAAAAAQHLSIPIVNLSPAGGFLVAFQVAIYAGIVLAAPFILYFIAAFVFPALRMKEKKYTYTGLFYALGLFFVGVAFCYFVLMPVALTASVQYSEWLGAAMAGRGLHRIRLEVHARHGRRLRVAGGDPRAGQDWRAELPDSLQGPALCDRDQLRFGRNPDNAGGHHAMPHGSPAASSVRDHRLDRVVLGAQGEETSRSRAGRGSHVSRQEPGTA